MMIDSQDETLMRENPFQVFVARADTPDEVDVLTPREHVEAAIIDILKTVCGDKVPRILPVLGEAGYGKTHLYWALKKRHQNLNLVYVSPPLGAYDRLIQHAYFSAVKNLGYGVFDKVSESLRNRYGDLDKALLHNPGPATDVIHVLKRIENPKFRDVAARYLCGAPLSKSELELLGAQTPISREDAALQALRILAENLEKPLVLFLDELEAPYLEGGEEAQIRYLEAVKRIYNECKNIFIVMACLTDTWTKIIAAASSSAQGRVEKPQMLKRFTQKDISEFCHRVLTNFWKVKGITNPKSSTYPLTDNDTLSAYKSSHGNPREAIRWIKNRIEEKRLSILKQSHSLEPIELLENVIKLLRKRDNVLDIRISSKGENIQATVSKNGSELCLQIENEKLILRRNAGSSKDVSEVEADSITDLVIASLNNN